RIEREASSPKTPHRPSVYCGCVRLRRVLDKHKRIIRRKLLQAFHITGVTIQMHWYNRFRAAGESRLHLGGIKCVDIRLNIDKHRSSSNVQNNIGGCRETKSCGDHFVTTANIMRK